MKAINTYYNGYYFRSRTEAKWAIFFDLIGQKYIYELEGYELNDGRKYLPDFYFQNDDYYAEVKREGYDYSNEEIKLWGDFSLEIKKPIIILFGNPNADCTFGFFPDKNISERISICPFANKAKAKYGYFWNSNGESLSNYFTEQIITSSKSRFEYNYLNEK